MPAIVRGITANANCERYLVITKYNGVVPGTKMEIKGIGAYSQGIGSFARHYHLFANVAVTMLRSVAAPRLICPVPRASMVPAF